MASLTASMQAVRPSTHRVRGTALRAASNGSTTVMAADRAIWLPGGDFPKHLESSKLPGNFGFDPLGLGASEERLSWFAEAERVHCRWAMLGVAGILAQELVHPETFWYTSGATLELPFNLAGLAALELFAMHWAESKRGYDLKNPGSQDQDPVFSNFKLPAHDVGYPGGVFAPFVPGNLEELKLKEIKNGRLAMLAFIGFTMAAQVTGLNPLAALAEHLADPMNTNMFAKAAVVPGMAVAPPCKIPDSFTVQGITIPAGCFLTALWP